MNQVFEQQLKLLKVQYQHKLPSLLNDIIRLYNQLPSRADIVRDELLHQLHTLKGSSGTFGFLQVAQRAELIEQMLKDFYLQPGNHPAQLIDQLRDAMSELHQEIRAASRQPIQTDKTVATTLNAPKKDGANADLLLLEDEPIQSEVLRKNLAEFGYTLRACRNLSELNKELAMQKPDLLICDLTLPDSTEQDVFQQIQQLQRQGIPSLILSGRATFQLRVQAVRAGAAGYFLKSVKIHDLVNKIRDLTSFDSEKPYRVLMIDDQVSITQYYQQMLKFHGFDFRSLTEPSGLLELLEDFDPDIFLLDYHLEQYSGAEIARLIRQLPALESTPIVFLTAESVEQLKTNLVELGSDDVMRKDIKPDAFISQLTSRIKRGRKLRQQMKQDSLTQLYNHGYIQTVAQQLYALSQRKKTPCCFVMLDLDHFKSVNDRFGHAAGDRVLTALAQLLQQRLRNSDAIGRYGGEEFLLVMPDTAAADAFVVLNDIRLKFSQLVFSEANSSFQCTFSAGLVNSQLSDTAQQALEAADALLYQAKIAGRDQVKA